MKYKDNDFCDWCYQGFWDHDLSTAVTWGNTIFCCDLCRENYQRSKGYEEAST